MDAHVGAKLEVVAPRRVLTPTDYGCLLVLLLVSLGLHGWLASRSEVTARDGIEFARYALNLGASRTTPAKDGDSTPSVAETIRHPDRKHPPGYPAAILAVSQFLTAGEPQFRTLKAAKIVSLLAAALAVFPTYWLGRMLFSSKFVGFAGAMIFQTLPTVAHLTSDATSESLYLLFATTALLFGARGLRRRSPGMTLLCGIAAGLTYLVRPEGVMVPFAVGLTIAGAGLFRAWTRTEAVGQLLALGIGFALVAGPYMSAIGGFSNKTTFNEVFDRMKGNAPRPLWKGEAQAVRSPVLFADFHQGGNKTTWAVSAIVKETSKAAHYATFFLGIAGLLFHRRRIAADPGLAALPLLVLINAVVLGALAITIGYVSERHTVLIVLVLSLFAASALDPIWRHFEILPRVGARGLLIAVVGTSLPSAVKVPHEGRLGHPHAGRFLAEHVGPNDAVIDPFCWAEWYSGRALQSVPPDPAHPAVRWVVLETGKSPHSRLPRYQDALNVVNDGANPPKLAYWWPETIAEADAREKAKVLVYRQVVGPK